MKPRILIDGQWYEVGSLQVVERGKLYLSCMPSMPAGVFVAKVSDAKDKMQRHPLTPTEAPIEWKLGEACVESVPPEDRDKITGEYRPYKRGEYVAGTNGKISTKQEYDGCSYSFIILSPEPAPAPKTADELLLQDSLDALYMLRGGVTEEADKMITQLEDRLNG